MAATMESPPQSFVAGSAIFLMGAVFGLAMTVCASTPAIASTAGRTSAASPAYLAQDDGRLYKDSQRRAQDDDSQGDDTDVPPQDVDKYIKVYKAMQQNRGLTVEQAAAQQGLSVSDFRALENRIERNDALRQHVVESLKPQAGGSPAN